MARSGRQDNGASAWFTRFRRGVIAGLSIPILGLIILSVPVMLAWIVPGSDSVSASSAVRAAALALLSGLHGGVVLAGVLSTLTPLTVSAMLCWLMWGPARRMESTDGFVGLIAGFVAGCALLARWSSLGDTYAPVGRTVLASAVFVSLVGSAARWGGLAWEWIGPRARSVVVRAGAVLATYLTCAALLVAAMLVLHRDDAVALQSKVAPGGGGLALLLLGVGAAPTAVIATLGYLTGAGFTVGNLTSVSAIRTSRGALPDFPLLAALPHSGGVSAAGLLLIGSTALAASAVAVGMSSRVGGGWRGTVDLAGISGLVGVSLSLIGTIARGGIGAGALRGIGVQGWQIGLSSAVIVLIGSAVCTGCRALLGLFGRRAGDSSQRPSLRLIPDVQGDEALEGKPSSFDDDAAVEVTVKTVRETG